MKKYPIDNFYVGTLSFGLTMSNLLLKKEPKENEEKRNVIFSAKLDGAIDIGLLHLNWRYDRANRIKYEDIFTLFYKVDDESYICLHNGYTYKLSGIDYCSDLVPLKSCLPKMDYTIKEKISAHEARKLFKLLFKYKYNMGKYYNGSLYDIDNFYYGTLEHCDSLSRRNHGSLEIEYINYPSYFTLNKNGLYAQSGFGIYIDEEREIVADYSEYHVTLYKNNDEQYYCLNDYQIHDINNDEPKENHIRIYNTLGEELDSKNIPYESKITIPGALKLQRKIK